MAEVVFDFYDRLKSITSGYASFDYEFKDYQESDLVKVQILVNAEPVDALSFICHRSKVCIKGKIYCEKLKDLFQDNNLKFLYRPQLVVKLLLEKQ